MLAAVNPWSGARRKFESRIASSIVGFRKTTGVMIVRRRTAI
jgi:hypothetical protein